MSERPIISQGGRRSGPQVVPHGVVRSDLAPPTGGPASLADVLERVLDKGIVIAGDIQVNLLDIELLTIKIRLLVASVDRGKEMGIDWWENDPALSSRAADLEQENDTLRERLDRLEARLEIGPGGEAVAAAAQEAAARGGRVDLEQERTTVEKPGGRRSSTAQRRVSRERGK